MGDSFGSLSSSVLVGDRACSRDQARRLLAAARTRAVAAAAVPVPEDRPARPRGRGRTRATGRLPWSSVRRWYVAS